MKMPKFLPYKTQALFLALPLLLLGCKEQNNSFKVKPRPATTATPSEPNKITPQNKTGLSNAQLCAQELCQDIKQSSLESILEKAGAGTSEQNQYYQEHISPLVEKLITERQKSLETLLKKWTELESSYASVTWNAEQMRLLKLMLFINQSQLISQEQNEKIQISLTSQDFQKTFSEMQTQGAEMYFERMTGEKDFKLATEKILTELEKKNQSLNTIAGSNLFDEAGFIKRVRLQIASLPSSTRLPHMLLKDLASKSYVSELFYFFIAGSGKELLNQIPLREQDIKAHFTLQSAQSKLKSRQQSLTSDQEQCRIAYNQTINLYPTNASLSEFKMAAQKMIAEAHRLFPEGKNIQPSIMYPPTNLQMSQEFVEEIRFLANQEFANNELITDLPAPALGILAVATALSPSSHGSICKSKIDLDISDVAHQDSHSLAVSWYSVRFINEGLGILAHELGHVFERSMLPSKTSLKNCLVSKHGSSESERFLAEDFADHFSAQIMKSLNKHNPELRLNNFACTFMNKEALSLTTTKESTHSSPFFRALHIHEEAFGSLPESCQNELKKETMNDFVPGNCQ